MVYNDLCFDAKHLDVIADFHVVLDSIGKERITGHLNEFQAKDSVTGIDIRNLQTKFAYTKERISLRDITVQQKSTVLNVSSGEIVLPDKKEGREFSYATGLITGKAYLKVPSSAPARALSIDYSDGSTGIHAVENTGDADGQIYSVSGQRVAKPGKGLYIVNGKKVIFK